MATKFDKEAIPWRTPTQKVSCTKPMAPKHGKVVTFHEGLWSINSHNLLIECSREFTWQIKITVFPLSQCLFSQDLPGWWHTVRSSHRGGHVWSRDKLSTSYLHWMKTIDTTKLRKVLSYCERLPPLKPHDSLITWSTWR